MSGEPSWANQPGGPETEPQHTFDNTPNVAGLKAQLRKLQAEAVERERQLAAEHNPEYSAPLKGGFADSDEAEFKMTSLCHCDKRPSEILIGKGLFICENCTPRYCSQCHRCMAHCTCH